MPLQDSFCPTSNTYVVDCTQHTLIGLGRICDFYCKVIFTKNNVIIHDQSESPILTGWQKNNVVRLWRIVLAPTPWGIPIMPDNANEMNLKAYIAYDIRSVEALVWYVHAAARFPVRATWFKAIKEVNYRSWPRVTQANSISYWPSVDKTIKCHIVHSQQAVRSTKPKIPWWTITYNSPDESPLPSTKSKEIHIHTVHISKLYIRDTGRFPIKARIRNQYLKLI